MSTFFSVLFTSFKAVRKRGLVAAVTVLDNIIDDVTGRTPAQRYQIVFKPPA